MPYDTTTSSSPLLSFPQGFGNYQSLAASVAQVPVASTKPAGTVPSTPILAVAVGNTGSATYVVDTSHTAWPVPAEGLPVDVVTPSYDACGNLYTPGPRVIFRLPVPTLEQYLAGQSLLEAMTDAGTPFVPAYSVPMSAPLITNVTITNQAPTVTFVPVPDPLIVGYYMQVTPIGGGAISYPLSTSCTYGPTSPVNAASITPAGATQQPLSAGQEYTFALAGFYVDADHVGPFSAPSAPVTA